MTHGTHVLDLFLLRLFFFFYHFTIGNSTIPNPKGREHPFFFTLFSRTVNTGSCRVSQISCQGRSWLVYSAAYKDWSGPPGTSMELGVQLSFFSRLILLVAPPLPRSRPHPQTSPCSKATPHTENNHGRSLLSKGKLPCRLYTLKTGQLDGIPDHLSELKEHLL